MIVLDFPSHVAPEPAVARQDGLADTSHEDTEANLLGQNKTPKETNEGLFRSPNIQKSCT
jgi:hypothetical protein